MDTYSPLVPNDVGVQGNPQFSGFAFKLSTSAAFT